MSEFPVGRGAGQVFFSPAEQSIKVRAALRPNTCRWCLERFDPERQQPRSIRERGELRTHLKMPDNGSELVICDNCWSGANGYAEFIHGHAVPTNDPSIVPNPLLRALIEG